VDIKDPKSYTSAYSRSRSNLHTAHGITNSLMTVYLRTREASSSAKLIDFPSRKKYGEALVSTPNASNRRLHRGYLKVCKEYFQDDDESKLHLYAVDHQQFQVIHKRLLQVKIKSAYCSRDRQLPHHRSPCCQAIRLPHRSPRQHGRTCWSQRSSPNHQPHSTQENFRNTTPPLKTQLNSSVVQNLRTSSPAMYI
jgi:hypothetical protein